MSVFVTAGMKIFIGPAMAQSSSDFVLADFETSPAKTWVEIGQTETIGAFGDTAAEITADLIGRDRRIRAKGTRDAGSVSLVMLADGADAGQTALVAANATKRDYAFKVQFNNKSAASGAVDGLRYFVGQVLSASEQPDGANNYVKLNSSIGINSNIVKKAATTKAVAAIQGIGERIAQMSSVSAEIAASVDQQGQATREIAESVQRAAAGTHAMRGEIDDVAQSAGQMRAVTKEMMDAIHSMSDQSAGLRGEIDGFLGGIRAA